MVGTFHAKQVQPYYRRCELIYHKQTHKFGFEVPKTMEDALRIDKENGDTRWADAINKEMGKVCVTFKILADGEKAPVGYERIGCHLIFDVKMENFQFRQDCIDACRAQSLTSQNM